MKHYTQGNVCNAFNIYFIHKMNTQSDLGQSQNCHGDVKYSTGHIVNNTVISTYGTRCILIILEVLLCKVYDYLTIMLYT